MSIIVGTEILFFVFFNFVRRSLISNNKYIYQKSDASDTDFWRILRTYFKLFDVTLKFMHTFLFVNEGQILTTQNILIKVILMEF